MNVRYCARWDDDADVWAVFKDEGDACTRIATCGRLGSEQAHDIAKAMNAEQALLHVKAGWSMQSDWGNSRCR